MPASWSSTDDADTIAHESTLSTAPRQQVGLGAVESMCLEYGQGVLTPTLTFPIVCRYRALSIRNKRKVPMKGGAAYCLGRGNSDWSGTRNLPTGRSLSVLHVLSNSRHMIHQLRIAGEAAAQACLASLAIETRA